MKQSFSNRKSEKGQGLVEYAILVAVLSVVVIGSMVFMGSRTNCAFTKVNNSLPGPTSGSSNCGGPSQSGGGSSPAQNVVVPTVDPYGSYIAAAAKKQDDAIENFCENVSEGTTYKLYYNSASKRYIAAGSATNLANPNALSRTGVCDD